MIRTGLSREAYDALDACNFSTLKALRTPGGSPAHYLHRLSHPTPRTDILDIGHATHLAVLEPERFADEVVSCDIRRDARTAAYREFLARNAGRTILKPDDFQLCLDLAAAARANPDLAPYLADGDAEVTLTWTDPETGLPCKGRVDFLSRHNGGAIIDLKTTRRADPDAFAREVWNFRYHTQGAMYQDGVADGNGGVLLPVLLAAVEKEPPFVSQLYQLPDYWLDAGREEYREWLRTVSRCRLESKWPGYAEGIVILTPPRWTPIGEDEDEDLSGLGLEFEKEDAA
jgi:hypothetical protein